MFDLFEDTTQERTFWITKGLGAGGTYGAAIWHLLLCLVNNKSPRSWVVGPTFANVEDTLIPTFAEVAHDLFGFEDGVDFKFVRSTRPRMDLIRSRQSIYFKSANNPDSLVGPSISHVMGTEPGLYKETVFQKCIVRVRCPRAIRKQHLWEGTPEGLENYYAQEADFEPGLHPTKNYKRIILHTEDNTHIPDSYVLKLWDVYGHDPARYESYRYGLFKPFTKGSAYWEYRDTIGKNVVLDVSASEHLPLLFCWDFNRSPLAWVTMQRQPFERKYTRRDRFVALGESSGASKGLLDACAEFITAFPPSKFRDTPIEIYGDPYGFHTTHRSPSDDFDTIVQHLRPYYRDVQICAAHAAPRERQRLERHNLLLAHEMFVVASWCKNLRRSHIVTDLVPGTWKIRKPPEDDWTHYADAVGYPLFQLTKDLDLDRPNFKRFQGTNKPI